MKIGPKQLTWVASHGFPHGAFVLHLGPVMLAVRMPERVPVQDPPEWNEQKAPAPTIDPRRNR